MGISYNTGFSWNGLLIKGHSDKRAFWKKCLFIKWPSYESAFILKGILIKGPANKRSFLQKYLLVKGNSYKRAFLIKGHFLHSDKGQSYKREFWKKGILIKEYSEKGAFGVGSATTNAVVLSSILILVFNYFLTEMFF